ncbi:MAG: bifunctional DNA-formamidopyrimidine glycosylase/DNA-(apurinic or apyrimidinic site) lyase [Chloroflexota bacterium]
MPELPEVETIRTLLSQGGPNNAPVLGQVIRNARLLWDRSLATPTPAEFLERVRGQSIDQIGRRGKYLIFYLSQDALLVHLRMSGDLLVEPADAPLAPHHRLVLDFENGLRLAFNDARKFGRVWLVADPQQVLAGLGPEPLETDFTVQTLFQALQARQRQLKPLLLDQSFLAGLGNIYVDEALHLAGLHPLALSNQVSLDQAQRLWQGIRQVLQEGIRRNGASIDWVYRGGDFQNYFRVYQRTGEPCPVCATPVERIVVGQRGTHFCPVCQPAPGRS